MSRFGRRLARMTALLAAFVVPAAAENAAGEARERDGGRTRVTLGLRLTGFRLEESRRPGADGVLDNANLDTNFLGSLWGLDARQSALPRPYAEVRVWRGLVLGLEYDQQRARTLDWANEEKTATAGDGDVQIRGGTAYAGWRLAVDRRFTVSARAGYARYWSRFFVSLGWSPGPDRYFVVEDTDGWMADVGCRYAIARHIGVEAGLRHLQVGDIQAEAVLSKRSSRQGSFPMRSDSVHVGIDFAF